MQIGSFCKTKHVQQELDNGGRLRMSEATSHSTLHFALQVIGVHVSEAETRTFYQIPCLSGSLGILLLIAAFKSPNSWKLEMCLK